MNESPASSSQTAPYTTKVGGKIGRNFFISYNCSGPIGDLSIAADSISVSVKIKHVTIQKSSVDSVIPYRLPLGKGIQIKHHQPDTSPFVVVFPVNYGETMQVFKDAGYPTAV